MNMHSISLKEVGFLSLSPALIREVASDLTSILAGSIRRERYMYVHVALARKITQFISFHNDYLTFNESQLDRK